MQLVKTIKKMTTSSYIGQEGVSHAQAREIIRQAWQLVHNRMPTERELSYAQSIASFETGYGRLGQFAEMARRGMYNWGALQRPRNLDGSCPPGTSSGMDASNPRCFYVFSSDLDAARRYLWELTKNPRYTARVSATLRAMANGTPEDVAIAMKTPAAWYEAPVALYAKAIRNGLHAIGAGTLGPAIQEQSTTSGLAVAASLLVGGGAIYYFATRR